MWPRVIFVLILTILIFALVASLHNMTYSMAAREKDMGWAFLKAFAIDGGIGIIDYFIAWNRMKGKPTRFLWSLNIMMIVISIYGNMKYHIIHANIKDLHKFGAAIGLSDSTVLLLDAAIAAGLIAILIIGMSEALALVYTRMFYEDRQAKKVVTIQSKEKAIHTPKNISPRKKQEKVERKKVRVDRKSVTTEPDLPAEPAIQSIPESLSNEEIKQGTIPVKKNQPNNSVSGMKSE